MCLFNSFRFMFYSGKRSVRIPFAHIGQMVSVPLLFVTTFFFQFVSCLSPIIRCTHHTIPLVIGWTFEITPIIRIRIVYDTSGNHTLHGLPIWYFLNGAWILYYFILSGYFITLFYFYFSKSTINSPN